MGGFSTRNGQKRDQNLRSSKIGAFSLRNAQKRDQNLRSSKIGGIFNP
jgi:hypothetical protein